jgi:hypothetical protein
VIVNLRLDTDVETEFVSFDRPRVVRMLERIAADLDNLCLVPNDPQADTESNQNDPQARHPRELAEPSRLAVIPAPLATYLADKADPSIWKAGQ